MKESRLAEKTEGFVSRAGIEKNGQDEGEMTAGEEDRNEHLVGRSKDGSFKKHICKSSEVLLALEPTT